MSQITTHILDTTKGKPAAGVTITLFSEGDDDWSELASGETNADGRISDLLSKDIVLVPGNYKMRFETGDYFNKHNLPIFYPFVEIVFCITSTEHYHIPLLLTPFGYSTYRGS